jgi:hypothetical protein
MSTYTNNNVNYLYTVGSGVASVTTSSSASGAISILSSFVIDSVTYNVTSINANAFNGCTGITSVTIPSSITSIGSGAFRHCTGLTSLTIPSSITNISTDAFAKCTALETINNIHIVGSEYNMIYSISISNSNNTIIFNGYLHVYKFINLVHFFYNSAEFMPSNLLAHTSDYYGVDYTFSNGYFSSGGTAIYSILSLDQQYGAQEWSIRFDGTNHFLSYKNSQNDWIDLSEPYTVTAIDETPPRPPPPSTPTITSISAYNNTATINFTQTPLDETITNYAYSYSTDGNVTFTDPILCYPGTTTSPLTVPNLTNGSVISFRIKSWNVAWALYSDNSNTFYNQYVYTTEPIVCFKDTTKILTDNGYIAIQDLKNGDLVETFGHGLKPIIVIKKKEIIHELNQNKIPDQLYKYSRETSGYNELTEDLIITGRHAILVDNFESETQKDNVTKFCGTIQQTDNKYHLPACVDDKSTVYEISGKHTVYNLALQSDNENTRYGIYANGLLVETCSEKYLKNITTMKNIE